MEPFRNVLLSVWREACRHIGIHESTATITRLVARRLPIDGVMVREFDVERSSVGTVAIALVGRGAPEGTGRTECSPAEMKALLAWCERGEIARRGRGAAHRGNFARAIPSRLEGDVLVGPLTNRQGPLGVLLLLGRSSPPLGPEHETIFRALLEPFAVALENDHRLRELAALREAAEADRRALLIRLGRTQLGDTIVGTDAGLRPVMERVKLVSRSDVPVLIIGETGSGKEVVARAIHTGSPRAAGPFIRVNCGAIPQELIDSQLFGHERGSFTGATDTHRGWFERADDGTLFLDEIGDLPLAAQVRLLRIVQDGYLERVGGHDPIKVDVRIVAATHRDLSVMVREGRFREDLWYRIAVFPMLLPPVRERREDIPALVHHFAQRAATRFGLPLTLPSPEDLATLVAYPWPGNVRELAAVIDRAAILGNGERLEVAAALGVSSRGAARSEAARQPEPVGRAAVSTVVPLDTAMGQHIETALVTTRGRIEGPYGAARLLGINPHTLRARMRKLGIDWDRFRVRD